jgi:hypothetical protein
MNDEAPPPTPGSLAWISGKTLEELDAIEHGGALLFRDAFRTKNKRGEEVLTPVLVSPPTRRDRAEARIDAIRYVADLCKSKAIRTVPEAQTAIGAEVFEDIDTISIIARCCYEPKEPSQRAYMLDILIDSFPSATLADMWERINHYAHLVDPRVPEPLSHDEFWAYAKAIAKAGNVGPLVVMREDTQRGFVISMARRLIEFRELASSSTSSATSTPG